METARKFTCLGDLVSISVGCVELLYGKRFPLKLKGLFKRAMQGQQFHMVLESKKDSSNYSNNICSI